MGARSVVLVEVQQMARIGIDKDLHLSRFLRGKEAHAP